MDITKQLVLLKKEYAHFITGTDTVKDAISQQEIPHGSSQRELYFTSYNIDSTIAARRLAERHFSCPHAAGTSLMNS